jgi:large subunit ribosomal protein L32
MGLPGKRLSRSSKRRRAAKVRLKPISVTTCPSCQATILPHRACPSCGMYRGHSTASPLARVAKKPTAKPKAKAKAKAKKA